MWHFTKRKTSKCDSQSNFTCLQEVPVQVKFGSIFWLCAMTADSPTLTFFRAKLSFMKFNGETCNVIALGLEQYIVPVAVLFPDW